MKTTLQQPRKIVLVICVLLSTVCVTASTRQAIKNNLKKAGTVLLPAATGFIGYQAGFNDGIKTFQPKEWIAACRTGFEAGAEGTGREIAMIKITETEDGIKAQIIAIEPKRSQFPGFSDPKDSDTI